MNKKRNLPFQNLNAKNWQNLAIVATLVLYLTQLWSERLRLFWSIGSDFMAYWSAGHLANHWGYAQVYNLALLEKTQHWMIFGNLQPDITFHPIPMPYLPIFALPFQAFALLPPVASFYCWTLVNFVAGVLYLISFTKNISHENKNRILFLSILSFPFFQSLFWGQINIFIMIFLGEFIRAMQNRKEVRAGLWLSALLLKPQILIVIIPALLITQKIKPLFGIAIGTMALMSASFLLAGTEGIAGMVNLWFGYADTMATNSPEAMGNWRMAGIFINYLSDSTFGSIFTLLATTATVLWALYLWLTTDISSEISFILLMTATFAATGLATWHSHAHMAIILLPMLIILYLKNELPQKLVSLWIFLPPLLYLVGLISMVFIRDRFFQGIIYGPAQLILHLTLLIWATRKLVRRKKEEAHGSLA